MTELEELENAIRAEADRKITTGRELSGAAASVLEALERYRRCYGEAVAAGFTEAELKRYGLTVDDVKASPSKTRSKALGRRNGRGRNRLPAPAVAEETADNAERDDAAVSA